MKRLSISPIAAALLLAAAPLWTSAQDKKGVTEPELKYQAGSSPLGAESMYQSTNPKAPPPQQPSPEGPRQRPRRPGGMLPVANRSALSAGHSQS